MRFFMKLVDPETSAVKIQTCLTCKNEGTLRAHLMDKNSSLAADSYTLSLFKARRLKSILKPWVYRSTPDELTSSSFTPAAESVDGLDTSAGVVVGLTLTLLERLQFADDDIVFEELCNMGFDIMTETESSGAETAPGIVVLRVGIISRPDGTVGGCVARRSNFEISKGNLLEVAGAADIGDEDMEPKNGGP